MMFWGGILLVLLGWSNLPLGGSEEKKSQKRMMDGNFVLENGVSSEEESVKLEKILLGQLEVTVPPEKHPLLPPKTERRLSFNVTLISVPQPEKKKKTEVLEVETEEDEEDLEEEDGDEKGKVVSKEDNVQTTTQAATTVPADDNLSYIMSRLSSIEAAIHRLNVQFYGLDVKVTQMSQSVSKIRTKLSETEDAITTASEMNLRNQRQIGQIEGCLKGRRLSRKCYLIFQQFETYAKAQELCHGRGGNLAMPVDQQDFVALAQYVHDAFFPFNWPVWIGINDLRSEGLYLYENGHRVSFFNWYKDHLVTQPNGGALENCLSISTADGKWWDNDCTRRMYYVCEY